MQGTTDTTAHGTHRIDVYEPAMCCSTGVCGTDPSETLIEFTANCAAAGTEGATIARHNLANDPQAFVSNPQVRGALDTAGSEALPIVQVDGQTVLTGVYPTRVQLLRMAGVAEPHTLPVTDVTSGQSGCCGGGSGCC